MKKRKNKRDLHWRKTPCKPKKKERIKVKFSAPQLKEENTMQEKTITNLQKIEATIIQPKKADGSNAEILGIPTWVVESGDSTVEAEEDGLSAFLVSAETNGDTTYKVTASVDRGTGEKDETITIVLHVSDDGEPEVGTLEVSFGEPVLK